MSVFIYFLFSVRVLRIAGPQFGFKETLLQQFELVQKGTKKSAVQKYGTFSFMNEPIGDFFGAVTAAAAAEDGSSSSATATFSDAVGKQDSRDIKVHYLFNQYLRKKDKIDGHTLSRTEVMANGMELLNEIKQRLGKSFGEDFALSRGRA